MKNLFKKIKNMATFNFGNNSTFVGNQISVKNNRIIIDGVDVTPDSKIINITVTGNVENIKCDNVEKITVNGNVSNDVITVNGDVDCQDIGGDIKTTNGDVKSGNVSGKISTVNGDIKHNKK